MKVISRSQSSVIIIIVTSLIYFIFLLYIRLSNQVPQIDLNIYQFTIEHRNSFFTNFVETITLMGETYVIISLTILISILLYFKKMYKESIILFLSVFMNYSFLYIIKNTVQRVRPDLLSLESSSSFSFPSGHTLLSLILYGIILIVLQKIIKRKYLKWLINIFFIVLIILVGISRIYLGAHWATDVLSSFSIGFAYLVTIILFLYLKPISSI